MSDPTRDPREDPGADLAMLLTGTLTREAERLDATAGPGLTVDDVLARAGELRRRRRRLTTLAAAAVVLAIAVPVGISAAGGRRTPEPTAPTASDHSAISVNGLTYGLPPRIPYSADWVLHAGGSVFTLPGRARPSYLAQIDGGYLAGSAGAGGVRARLLTADGTATGRSWPMQGGFAVSPDGGIGAFVQPDGTVVAVENGGARVTDVGHLAAGSGYEVAAVRGTSCAGSAAKGRCTVYVNQTDQDPKIWAVAPHAAPQLVRPGLLELTGISTGGLVGGYVKVTDDGSCSQVRDDADVAQWETCEDRLLAFSPDGQHLLASAPYADGAGDTRLTVIDAGTGKVGLELHTVRNAVVSQVRWEDDTHVLAVVVERGLSAIVRLDLRGNREYARPQVTAQGSVSPFLLAIVADLPLTAG